MSPLTSIGDMRSPPPFRVGSGAGRSCPRSSRSPCLFLEALSGERLKVFESFVCVDIRGLAPRSPSKPTSDGTWTKTAPRSPSSLSCTMTLCFLSWQLNSIVMLVNTLTKGWLSLKGQGFDGFGQWTIYLELVYLVTALVPSETACLASSPGNRSLTEVWISRDVMVDLLL